MNDDGIPERIAVALSLDRPVGDEAIERGYSTLVDKLRQLVYCIDDLHCAAAIRAGLSRSEFNALACIVRSDGLTVDQLASALCEGRGAAGKLVGRLERSGRVVRGRDADQVVMRPTERGRREMEATRSILQAEVGRLSRDHSGEELALLTDFMARAGRSIVDRAAGLAASPAAPGR